MTRPLTTSLLPFSPLTWEEVAWRRRAALERAGIAMVTAHHNPHDRDGYVEDAAGIVAEYDMWFQASAARGRRSS